MNRQRYPTASVVAPIGGLDVQFTLAGLMDRFSWSTVGLICDSMTHLLGLANFFYVRCKEVKELFARKDFVWLSADLDTAKDRSFDKHLIRLSKHCRSRLSAI